MPDPSDGDEDLDVDDEEDDEGDDADDEKPRHGLVPEVEVEVEVEDRMVAAVRTLRIMADFKNVTDNSYYIIGFQFKFFYHPSYLLHFAYTIDGK